MNIKKIISLMEQPKEVYLATLNAEGEPEIRALLNLANPKNYPKLVGKAYSVDGETIIYYIATNTSSRKTAQLRANQKASLYFCIPEKFLGANFTGCVEEITDMETKKELWQTAWMMYYHKGVTDPDYTVFKFTSKSIHAWGSLGIHNFGEAPVQENVDTLGK